jgi:biotin operon repressor
MHECGEDFWSLLDGEVLDGLACGRPLSSEEVGEKLGMSAKAAASLLTMLVHDGRVRITAVELVPR